ncbi:putative carboxylesterase 2 [Glycine soja]|uniref:Putative carboxylesterase 2 n=1 Tax=Glycine soja TaxID=3848 RepID=A0A445JZJ6_GLYSO|nr:putative carboxylesterase 2 [Glycine soja]
MASTTTDDSEEVTYDLSPVLKVYKSGRIKRLAGTAILPPGLDPETNVESKDIVISEEHKISARLFIPKNTYTYPQKLPLLFYTHGGAFCIETLFSPNYHNLLNKVVSVVTIVYGKPKKLLAESRTMSLSLRLSKANVVAVSVHYRRAPEHPVHIGHEDSWCALKWVASHRRCNIASYLGIRVGTKGLLGVKLKGVVLVHPFFWGEELFGCETNRPDQAKKIHNLWRFACPSESGSDDPIINPIKDPKLGKLACERLLLCVAEKDLVRDRGLYYKELLEKNGWFGVAEVVETKDEDHVFHLFKPNCENALVLIDQIVSFLKQD